ncbi:MAG TPA: PLP-dependent aminotransferase family protein [Acidimicrobiales bacterium]|nr:PLP-dependent aminotransferase family protein [Acidimicrobiales bacterium]
MSDFHLDIDNALGRRAGLEVAIRGAIRAGALVSGALLPGSRALANELGISRSTVVEAYGQLAAEGFLDMRQGSGTRVAALARPAAIATGSAPEPPAFSMAFVPGEPDLTSFPRAAWSTTVRAVLRDTPTSTFAYGDPFGLHELRTTLVGHLGRARAVVAAPDRVVVFSGVGDALATVIPALARIDVGHVALEEPCLPWHRGAVSRTAAVHNVHVDEQGLRVDALASTPARAVLVTPAHQYPLGVTMSPTRRAELVAWARDADAWIIEDDYDGEFRYDRHPVGSLQGIASDRVIYAGTASKSIVPGIGIGWLVVPEPLVGHLRDVLNHRITTSTIEQAVLSRFIDTGRLDRHLRRMRGVYRRRREQLLEVLADVRALSLRGLAAGLHVTAQVASLEAEQTVADHAAASGLALFRLSTHYGEAAKLHGIVFGFTRSPEHAWPSALRKLRAALAHA